MYLADEILLWSNVQPFFDDVPQHLCLPFLKLLNNVVAAHDRMREHADHNQVLAEGQRRREVAVQAQHVRQMSRSSDP